MSAEDRTLARGQYQAKDLAAAVATYSKLIDKSPSDPDLRYERALTYIHLQQPKMALMDLDSAQNLEPNNPFRYASRAYVKDMLGDVAGAIADYEKALELDPQDAVCHNNLGLLQEKMGRMQQANKHFKSADQLADEFFENAGGPPDEESDKPASPSPTKEPQPDDVSPVKPSFKDYTKVIGGVFTSRQQFKAFIQFIKGNKPTE